MLYHLCPLVCEVVISLSIFFSLWLWHMCVCAVNTGGWGVLLCFHEWSRPRSVVDFRRPGSSGISSQTKPSMANHIACSTGCLTQCLKPRSSLTHLGRKRMLTIAVRLKQPNKQNSGKRKESQLKGKKKTSTYTFPCLPIPL